MNALSLLADSQMLPMGEPLAPGSWLVVAVLASALGLGLMMPRFSRSLRRAGIVVALVGLGLLAAHIPLPATWTERIVLGGLSAITLFAAAGTVTMRAPIYSAVSFAVALLGTAGLMLLAGAQFLGVATVVVYAGAIVVTILFVLMLAQPQGHSYYDRVSWGVLPATIATLASAAIVGLLTWSIALLKASPGEQASAALSQSNQATAAGGHVARLGAELFGMHLIAVQVVGTLLLVALVGAVAIVLQGGGQPVDEQESETQ